MPEYTCEKCASVFKQKSGYDSHMKRKKPCSQRTNVPAIIESAVRAVKEAVQVKPKEFILPDEPKAKADALQKFFESLHNLLWTRAGLDVQPALDHLIFFFAYRLIEIQIDNLNLPQECRWSYLANITDDDILYETMKKGVIAFQKNKVTKQFFKKPEIKQAELVREIILQINKISIKILRETDTLGNIFEYMLGRGMSTMGNQGQYYTNRQICALAFKLAHSIHPSLCQPDGSLCTFADWFCGTGGFVSEYVKGVKTNIPDIDWKKHQKSIMCQDMSVSSITTTLLNLLILTGIPFSSDNIRSGNSFVDPITIGSTAPFKEKTIDFCFMNPPYGGDKTTGKEYRFTYCKEVKDETGKKVKKYCVNQEIQSIGIEDDDKVSAGVQLCLSTMSSNGVAVLVLWDSFFSGKSNKTVELRKKIVEEYKVHFIVDIPSGSFFNTPTKTSMIVFEKGKITDTIKFMDIEQKELAEATLEDLRNKNYLLKYRSYIPQIALEVEGFEIVKLSDILELKKSGKTKVADITNSGEYPFYSCKILNPCGTHSSFDHDESEYLLFAKSGGNSKQPTGDNLGIGRFYYMTNKSASTSDVSKFILKNQSISLKYVSLVLKTKLHQIQSLAKYTTGLGHIDIEQMLDEIQIPLPSIERQQEIVEAIDGWANLAQQEEATLKLLEKQVMFQVKEMGRGQPRVKLGDVCEFKRGKMITKKDLIEGEFPVIGGGLSPMGYHNSFNRDAYTVLISQSGENAGYVSRYTKSIWASDCFSVSSTQITDDFIYFLLKQKQDEINFLKTGSAQPHIYPSSIDGIEIPLPPLTQQQTLQPDFDEIRHKHEKIAYYKAKAQEAIAAHIPRNE
jgi:type I restriction-modification system DNA methylase subunit